MVKKLIALLLLVLWGTQLSWPMAAHHLSAHAPKEVVMVAGHQHSIAGGHDCCPQVAARFEIQAPVSGPCDNQHRCCIGSREVPVVQASSAPSGPEFDRVNSGIKQSAAISLPSKKPAQDVGPPSRQASIMVLRV
jgi:hypothetical protein